MVRCRDVPPRPATAQAQHGGGKGQRAKGKGPSLRPATTAIGRYMRAPPADLFSSMKRDHPAAINAAPPGADTIVLRLDPTKPQTYTNQGNQQTFAKVLTKMYPVSNLTPSGIAVDTGNYAGVVARGVRPRWSKAPQFLDDKYDEEDDDDAAAAVASPEEVDNGYAKIEDWSPAMLVRFRAEASHRLDYVRAKAMELTGGIADPTRRVSLGARDRVCLHEECDSWLRCPRRENGRQIIDHRVLAAIVSSQCALRPVAP